MMTVARRLAAKAGINEDAQQGAAVVIVAISMIILLGFAAFSVDFGWLYLNGIRIQHGADAAALSGVVYEPGDQATAYQEARNAAAENSFNDGAAGTTVTPVDYADNPSAVENQYQLRVTIDHSVDTFFMRLFGIDSISMTRTAVAEYVLPLPMGSDLPYFGEDPSIAGRDPHFWANIHGYNTGRQLGDRFSSQCLHDQAGSGCEANPERRTTTFSSGIPATGGYMYGIEVAAGASDLAVEILDGAFYYGGGDHVLVGDNSHWDNLATPVREVPGPTTWFVLYAPDPTPLNTSDNAVLCSVKYDPADSFANFNGDHILDGGDDQDGDGDLDWDDVEAGVPGGISSLWDRMCGTTFNSGAGVYPLRVVTEDDGGQGLNRYSLRAWANGADPRVYGLGDMAIYANFPGSSTTFNLAEVLPVHAGKDLVIELWDPDSGNNGTEIRMPDGSLPTCTWSSTDGRSGGPMPCDINYGTSFNDHHMQIRIEVSDTYTCAADCWWTINVSYPSGAQDTTTWSARIEGNPVALVE